MRHLILALAVTVLTVFASNEAQALRLKVKPGIYNWYSGGGGSYTVGIGFEKADGGKFGMQHNLELDFNALNPLLRYKPEFRFYLLDEAPSGLYVGGYTTLGATTGKIFGSRLTNIVWGAGGLVGYQFMFADDKFSVDATYAFGYGGIMGIADAGFAGTTTTVTSHFNMIPSIAMGFHF